MARRGRFNLSDERFFFVTTTIVNFATVFTQDKYCDILIHQIREWQSHFGFAVLGYVIMPTHFHWIVEVEPKRGTISDVMREIKSHSAWSPMDTLLKDGQQSLSGLFAASGRGLPDQRRRFWMKRFDDQVTTSHGARMVRRSRDSTGVAHLGRHGFADFPKRPDEIPTACAIVLR